jgi:Mn2+/Fe2+ NRAMP family transporter
VWTVGAEILHPTGIRVVDIASLARLLGEALGQFGTTLFYLGIFAALFSNTVGSAAAYSYLACDAFFHSRREDRRPAENEPGRGGLYKLSVTFLVFSPLIWIGMGKVEFVGLTLLVNAAQTVLIPMLAGGVWIITARAKFIGPAYRNRWWENLAVGLLFLFGCISAVMAGVKLLEGLGLLASASGRQLAV